MLASMPALVDRSAAALDSWLATFAHTLAQRRSRDAARGLQLDDSNLRWLETAAGTIRALDTGSPAQSTSPCIVIVPDGPNVIEHYAAVISQLAHSARVVCFDMPGFGFSKPRSDYRHTLDEGARAVLSVMDLLGIQRATLAFSCANGFYALRAARLAQDRVASLFLSQTPSLRAMHAWVERVIPKPLRVPVVGQTIAWLGRETFARGWYARALPRHTDRQPYRDIAKTALKAGACFSLAGVVQGLSAGLPSELEGVTAPCTLLWGQQDRSHHKSDPRSLLECAVHANIHTFEQFGHFPDLEIPNYPALLSEHVARVHLNVTSST
jgi:pimeloyl-ACP methyl ester carboxylesterase